MAEIGGVGSRMVQYPKVEFASKVCVERRHKRRRKEIFEIQSRDNLDLPTSHSSLSTPRNRVVLRMSRSQDDEDSMDLSDVDSLRPALALLDISHGDAYSDGNIRARKRANREVRPIAGKATVERLPLPSPAIYTGSDVDQSDDELRKIQVPALIQAAKQAIARPEAPLPIPLLASLPFDEDEDAMDFLPTPEPDGGDSMRPPASRKRAFNTYVRELRVTPVRALLSLSLIFSHYQEILNFF